MSRVVFISSTLDFGGTERVISILANHFNKINGIEVHILLFTKQSPKYSLGKGVQVHFGVSEDNRFDNWIKYFKVLIFIVKELIKIRPIAAVSMNRKFNSLSIISGLISRTNIFVSDRSRPGISSGFFIDRLNKFFYRYAKGIICQTTESASFFKTIYLLDNIKVIGNPVPLLLNPSIRKERIILNVGRFIRSKHQADLIRVFSRITHKGIFDWKLVFLGDGAHLDDCMDLSNNLGLNDRVIFEGNVSNVESYYYKAEVFAFTSASEGFPNSLAEAMSAGCSVISFDCSAGPSDLIDDGINGFLVKSRDINEYEIKMARLLTDDKLRKAFSAKARDKMKEYDSKGISLEYLEYILD